MLTPERTALVLLAAGRSRRFDGDKLAEPFLDKPLALSCRDRARECALPDADRSGLQGTRLDFAALGYRVEENPDPSRGQARSLCHGVAAVAKEAGAEAVLVALADMPRVTAAHIHRMFDTADGPDTVVASSDGAHPCPPALFGSDQFDRLLAGGRRRRARADPARAPCRDQPGGTGRYRYAAKTWRNCASSTAWRPTANSRRLFVP
jgi:molybdenum cofactor cytidylyltransferase